MRGDNISTVEGIQYCGGIPSVLWGVTAVHVGDTFSTVEGIQYCGGIPSVLWGVTAVHVGGTFSTVEVVQYSGGITSVQLGDSFSTVEGIQYSGGRILISTCLVINNDEKISIFFVLRYEIFIRKFFENSSRFHAF